MSADDDLFKKIPITIDGSCYMLNELSKDELSEILSHHYNFEHFFRDKDEYIDAIINEYFKDPIDIDKNHRQILINDQHFTSLIKILQECFNYDDEKIQEREMKRRVDCKRVILVELQSRQGVTSATVLAATTKVTKLDIGARILQVAGADVTDTATHPALETVPSASVGAGQDEYKDKDKDKDEDIDENNEKEVQVEVELELELQVKQGKGNNNINNIMSEEEFEQAWKKIPMTIDGGQHMLGDMTRDDLCGILSYHYGIEHFLKPKNYYVNTIIDEYFKKNGINISGIKSITIDDNDNNSEQVFINDKNLDELIDILKINYNYTTGQLSRRNITTINDCKRAILIELECKTFIQFLQKQEEEKKQLILREEEIKIEYYCNNFKLRELHNILRYQYKQRKEYLKLNCATKLDSAKLIREFEKKEENGKTDTIYSIEHDHGSNSGCCCCCCDCELHLCFCHCIPNFKYDIRKIWKHNHQICDFNDKCSWYCTDINCIECCNFSFRCGKFNTNNYKCGCCQILDTLPDEEDGDPISNGISGCVWGFVVGFLIFIVFFFVVIFSINKEWNLLIEALIIWAIFVVACCMIGCGQGTLAMNNIDTFGCLDGDGDGDDDCKIM